MIRHVVLYTIKDECKEKIPELVKAFYGMKDKIPGLVSLEAGGDELHSERSYDLALITVSISLLLPTTKDALTPFTVRSSSATCAHISCASGMT